MQTNYFKISNGIMIVLWGGVVKKVTMILRSFEINLNFHFGKIMNQLPTTFNSWFHPKKENFLFHKKTNVFPFFFVIYVFLINEKTI